MVEFLAALGRPLQQFYGAVDGDALLVAGDEQRNRASLRPAAMRRQIIERRRDEAGDAALHVDGATSVQHVFRRRRRQKADATMPSSSPGGTTSVCPANTRLGLSLPMRA